MTPGELRQRMFACYYRDHLKASMSLANGWDPDEADANMKVVDHSVKILVEKYLKKPIQ